MYKLITIISFSLLTACGGGSDEPTNTINLQITWSDNSDNEDEFIVSRRMPGEEFTIIDYLSENETSFIDTDLDSGYIYCYKITASNEAGQADSEEVCR
jgi:hypothetical protein